MDSASIAEALGTWAIAILAIWGDGVRSRIFRPRLELRLDRSLGESAKQSTSVPNTFVDARYYHVQVSNFGGSPAHDVRVMLAKIEARGPDGAPQFVSSPEIPLNWRHQQIYPPARTVPRDTALSADLAYANANGLWALTPQLIPFSFEGNGRGEFHIWVHLIAVANECKSNTLVVKLDWDGTWHNGESEMAKHLKVIAA